MQLFDSHTHIQLSEFETDREAVIHRAEESGLRGLLALGIDPDSSRDAIALAKEHFSVHAAAGCHPHEAQTMDDNSWDLLTALVRLPEVTAVGEIGLDFYRSFSPHDTQVAALQRQLDLAAEVAKPVAIHCRNAHDALLPIIEGWSPRLDGHLPDGRPLGVMHYFSGDLALAQRYVELGFLISIHCSVTYPRAAALQEVAKELPLETLLIETDSPYGPPQSRRGQRNEPAYVAEAAAKIAELRGESAERVGEATMENAIRLFAPAARTDATTA